MIRRTRVLTSALGITTLGATALLSGSIREAHAEPPNVLIVLDTSGSMAFALDGTAANCSAGTPKPSRFAVAVQALTGTIEDPYCKSGAPFTGGASFTPNPPGSTSGLCAAPSSGSPSSSSNNNCSIHTCTGGYTPWCEELVVGACAADPYCGAAGGAAGGGEDDYTGAANAYKDWIPLGHQKDSDHVCVPGPSKLTGVWGTIESVKGSWPMRDNGNYNDKKAQPVLFRTAHIESSPIYINEDDCDWRQDTDGVLDTYADRARFGFASTDSLIAYQASWANHPSLHSMTFTDPDNFPTPLAAPYTMATWMPWLQQGDRSFHQYSYWYRDAASDFTDTSGSVPPGLWVALLNVSDPPLPSMPVILGLIAGYHGVRIGQPLGPLSTGPSNPQGLYPIADQRPWFNETFALPLAGSTNASTCPGVNAGPPAAAARSDRIPLGPYNSLVPATNFVGCLDNYDIGIKNSWAPPWQGRLLGFGRSSQTDTEFEQHNTMVQRVILGSGPYGRNSTPLGATMRDVHEFMRRDQVSVAAQVYGPKYDQSQAVTGTASDPVGTGGLPKIGPNLDPFVAQTGCRVQSVILITDGRVHRDIGETPDLHAENLLLNIGDAAAGYPVPVGASPIKTYVVGIMPSTFTDGGARNCATMDPAGVEFTVAGGFCYGAGFPNATTAAGKACCTVHMTALKGGTTKASIASTEDDVRSAMVGIVSGVEDEIVARTVPVFARATGVFAPPDNLAPANSFEIFSGMNTKAGGVVWPGFLHRLRKVCAGLVVNSDPAGGIPVGASADGDKFQDNICPGDGSGGVGACGPDKTTLNPRRFWTVVVPTETTKYASTGSIRPSGTDSTDDGIKSGVGVQTPLVAATNVGAANAFRDSIATAWANGEPTRKWLGIEGDSGDDDDDDDAKDRCDDLFGTTNLDTCADMVLRWTAGERVGSNNLQRASALGAIWRSNPVIVPPPQPNISDSSFSADTRTGLVSADPSFVTRHKERPTVVYAQTIDGLLHAFVVENNTEASDTTVGSCSFSSAALCEGYKHGDIPEADDGENNELWSFIPPAVARNLFPSVNTYARLLDGPITVRDVIFRRNASDRKQAIGNWRTVLVASSGDSDAGSFYYAIDVTNPLTPKFLWQLSLSDTGDPPDQGCFDSKGKKGKKCKKKSGDGKPIFGAAVPGATITTLRIDEGTVDHVAVAILPGGSPAATATGSIARRSSARLTGWPVGIKPRTTITDWSSAHFGRTVTVVELETGRVLARMVGEDGDNYDGLGAESGILVPKGETEFDSPMVGTAAAFPDFPGEPASRAYLGDSDGTLWRLDFTNADPMQWKARIAWDAYNSDALTNAKVLTAPYGATTALGWTAPAPPGLPLYNMAENIELSPVISVDENGNPIVVLATGDQETFKTRSVGAVNFLVSFGDPFVDPLVSYGGEGYSPVLRTQIAYKDGDRVTGPAALFDGKLYASHFVPKATGTCLGGEGGWCAFDYNDKASEGVGTVNDKFPDPVANLDGVGVGTAGYEVCADLDGIATGAQAFGVSLFQRPSCEVVATDFDDVWFGGEYSASNSTNSGTYQLVLQTGKGGAFEGDSDQVLTTAHKDLGAPNTATRIVSWTNVVE